MPAYREIGVELYSSAVLCFAPDISTAFHRAVESGDGDLVEGLLATFFRPLVALRDRVEHHMNSDVLVSGVRLSLRASVGYVATSDPSIAPDRLLHLADRDMYVSKRRRRETGADR